MKIFDKLLEIFMVLYEILLYSVIFQISLGIIILFIYPVAMWFIETGSVVKYGSSLIVGLCVFYWRKTKRNKQ